MDAKQWEAALFAAGSAAMKDAVDDLKAQPLTGPSPYSGLAARVNRAFRRQLILHVMGLNDWNLKASAQSIGMTSATLIRALKDFAPSEYQTARLDGRIRWGGKR